MKFKLALISAAMISASMLSGQAFAAQKYEIAVVAKVTGIRGLTAWRPASTKRQKNWMLMLTRPGLPHPIRRSR